VGVPDLVKHGLRRRNGRHGKSLAGN
jgi:hypothetical protein